MFSLMEGDASGGKKRETARYIMRDHLLLCSVHENEGVRFAIDVVDS